MSKKQPHFQYYCLIALIGLALLWGEVANAIQITEIMYNPKGQDLLDEFIELYNETAAHRDISGWKFTSGIDFVFPEGTDIEPRSYFVVARNPESLNKKRKIDVAVFGPFKGALSNQRDNLVLVDLAGGVMADVAYNSRGRWPIAPDGTGHSLSKIRPRLNANQPENWRASLQMGGTPGKDNGLEDISQELSPIAINEIFVSMERQFIEIYNRLSEPFDLSGYWVSNNPGNLKTYQVFAKTIIPPHGYKHLSLKELGFKLNKKGNRIFITVPDETRVIEACAFSRTGNLPVSSSGRYPDGSGEWYVMPPSPSETNTVKLNTDVVINEIMYHPPSESDDDEYVELYNCGDNPVDLSGWLITGGISFKFSRGTTISPKSYLVIAKVKAHLIFKYNLDYGLVLGDFKGRLNNEDETLRLRDNLGNKVDEVHYYEGGHWPKYADGLGSSLELIDPNQDNSNHQTWKPSNEAQKAEWTYVSYSGVWKGDERDGDFMESPSGTTVEFHFHLLGAGKMLIDDIRLTSPKTPFFARLTRRSGEYVANGSFERGLKNWAILGNHVQSHTVGAQPQHGRKCLKVVASGAGTTGPNHIEIPLHLPLKSNETYTISFWVKWQWGSNLLATRCLGNQISETHRIPIPKLMGTPGKRNSVYTPNFGPVFSDVRHSPVVPEPSDIVHVTARSFEPDGITSVTLYYKPDAALSYHQTAMYDDGQHTDGTANDGIYGGEIPPNHANQTVAFYIKAKDARGQTNTWPRELTSPGLYRIEEKAREKDEGESYILSALPTYRIIMTAEDTRELTQRTGLGNEPLNATFIFDEKDVYYQVTCRYTGSPHRRGRRGFSGYKIRFNNDEKLHGVKQQARFDRNDNSPEGFYNERVSYDMLRKMGVPTCEQEWIHIKFNGEESDLVWEDILPPSKRYLSTFYPNDSDGLLFEVIERFVFYGPPEDTGNFNTEHARFEWKGTDDKDWYRWHFLPRNHEQRDDFTDVIQLLKVMNTTPDEQYETAIDDIINVPEWLKVMAVRAVVSDWDFLGTNLGKNAYLYRPNKTGKWDLLSWDNEWGFEQTDMPIWASSPVIRRFQESPKHQHLYLSYVQELLDKYFNLTYLKPWFEHYHEIVHGVSPEQMASFVEGRTAYLNRTIPKAEVKITDWKIPLTPFSKGEVTEDGATIELEGSAPVQTRTARVAGNVYELNWNDATHWNLTISGVQEGELTLEFLDYDKKPIGKDAIQVTGLKIEE